tara:strand:+ start:239 stop:535 length:297 start_codon:yes stop_codon:yes gene_type:complete
MSIGHQAIMSDELAMNIGRGQYHPSWRSQAWKHTPKRDCGNCGYDIENGEICVISVWLPLDDMTSSNERYMPQWNVYHPLCLLKKMSHIITPKRVVAE